MKFTLVLHSYEMKEMGGKIRVGTDYVVSRYPPPPHTIHPPHQIATILEESVILPFLPGINDQKVNSIFYLRKYKQ